MRNLSKVLALVLSLAFVMTMFAGAVTTVNAETKYSDAAVTTAGNEAVSVLSALGIVKGYTDGTFQYTGEVTRAEFAAMISRATSVTAVESLYATATLPFTDYVPSWAYPYINYCYLNDIMVGNGDNTVSANANVTGVQAMKMVLVALGYDPAIEGLVGSNWVNNTVALARRTGLLVNLEGEKYDAAFDREATAILVYNAIYANTVEYVGNSAVASEYTLGEEVFDLLDVRGIVVANESLGLGMTWTDVLDAESGIYNKEAYINYQVAKSGTSTVVYRDYTGAATIGGYYVPRAITVAEKFATSELGTTYRILTTGAKNPTNTTEVRTVYGVLDVTDNGVTDGTPTSWKLYNYTYLGAETIIIDGSFTWNDLTGIAALTAWESANENSTSPVKVIDNNGDGKVDTILAWTAKYAEVVNVTDTAYTLDWDGVATSVSGKNTSVAIADVAGECVKGDWVRYDGLNGYSKLASVSGMITTAGVNSDGYYNWTIDGVKTTANSSSSGKMTGSAMASVLGGDVASVGVNATIWYDGSYAVAAKLNDTASWENYGIVIGWGDSWLGLDSVRLYTADNKYVDYVVTSINGNQNYDEVVRLAKLIDENTLVKYYVDGSTIALYTYSNDLMIGKKAVETTDVMYDVEYDAWSVDGAYYDWTDSVLFVAVADETTGLGVQYATSNTLVWRAYTYADFQPDRDFVANANKNQLVIDNYNNYIKVAAIIGNAGQVLPGLVIGGDEWLTVLGNPTMALTADENGKRTYTYTVTTLTPGYVSGKTTKTIVSSTPLTTLTDGNIYRATIDENGVVTYWQPVINKSGLGTNGIELSELYIWDYATVRGETWVKVSDGLDNANTEKLYITDATECYFVENLFTTDLAIEDDYVATLENMLELAAKNHWAVFADVNPTTKVVNTMWIDTVNTTTVNGTATLVSYNESTGYATYMVSYTHPKTNVVMTESKTVDTALAPYELPTKLGGELEATVTLYTDGSYKGASFTTKNENAAVVISGAEDMYVEWEAGKLTVWNGVPDTVGTTVVTYALDRNVNGDANVDGLQIWWARANTVNERLEFIASAANALHTGDVAYQTVADAWVSFTNANNVALTGSNNASDYETITLLDVDGDTDYDIIVLGDVSASNVGMDGYPYNLAK